MVGTKRFTRAAYSRRAQALGIELNLWASRYRTMTTQDEAWHHGILELETARWRAEVLAELAHELAEIAAKIDGLR